MANAWEKAILILVRNLNSGLSYLITTVFVWLIKVWKNKNIWVCLLLGFYNFVPTATPQQGNQRRGLMSQYPTISAQQPIWQKFFILYSTVANLTENLYSLFHNSQFDRKSLFQSPSFQLLLHSRQFDKKYLFFIPH